MYLYRYFYILSKDNSEDVIASGITIKKSVSDSVFFYMYTVKLPEILKYNNSYYILTHYNKLFEY